MTDIVLDQLFIIMCCLFCMIGGYLVGIRYYLPFQISALRIYSVNSGQLSFNHAVNLCPHRVISTCFILTNIFGSVEHFCGEVGHLGKGAADVHVVNFPQKA